MSREAHVRICERLGFMTPADSTAFNDAPKVWHGSYPWFSEKEVSDTNI